jgi:tetratricopeptide (TPR) repeat protein
MATSSLKSYLVNKSVLLAALLFLVTFVVYGMTLCPTVYIGDSGEFISTAFVLGINHPTGYPLHSLLGRFFVLILSFLPAAHAVNILSAFAASVSTVCIYLILETLRVKRAIAIVTALAYAWSITLWSRATIAEVYTLNAMFVALSLFFTVRWYLHGRVHDLFMLSFVSGLGLTQHITGVLVLPGVLLVCLLNRQRVSLHRKYLLLAVLLFIVGATIYLYLPVRSSASPPLNWGHPETVERLKDYFSLKGSVAFFGRSRAWSEDPTLWFLRQILTREFLYLGVLGLAGAAFLRKHQVLAISFIVIVALNVLFTVNRKLPLIGDFDAYFLPSYIVFAILIGLGFQGIWQAVDRRWSIASRWHFAQPGYLCGILLFPLVLLFSNYRANDRSNDFFAFDVGKQLMSSMEPGAILFALTDESAFLAWHFFYVEKRRPDISIVAVHKIRQAELEVKQILAANAGRRPVYFSFDVPWGFVKRNYSLCYRGLLIQILPRNVAPTFQPDSLFFRQPMLPQGADYRTVIIHQVIADKYFRNSQFWHQQGNDSAALDQLNNVMVMGYPRRDAPDNLGFVATARLYMSMRLFDRAKAALDSAIVYDPTNWLVYMLRGAVWLEVKDTSQARADWSTSLSLNPHNEELNQRLRALSPSISAVPDRLKRK